MANSAQITIDWRESAADLSEFQQEALTQTLLKELRQVDAVSHVSRVADADVPEGGMGAGDWLWGLVTAEIPGDGIREALKVALEEVFERLPGKPVGVTVEFEGRKIELSGVRPQDLDEVGEKALALAQKLKDV